MILSASMFSILVYSAVMMTALAPFILMLLLIKDLKRKELW